MEENKILDPTSSLPLKEMGLIKQFVNEISQEIKKEDCLLNLDLPSPQEDSPLKDENLKIEIEEEKEQLQEQLQEQLKEQLQEQLKEQLQEQLQEQEIEEEKIEKTEHEENVEKIETLETEILKNTILNEEILADVNRERKESSISILEVTEEKDDQKECEKAENIDCQEKEEVSSIYFKIILKQH